ncbi:hypothetical protein [Mediterraneibacter gnavus]|nr:hypothetical protein [Mediterraneibacter gnavus]
MDAFDDADEMPQVQNIYAYMANKECFVNTEFDGKFPLDWRGLKPEN